MVKRKRERKKHDVRPDHRTTGGDLSIPEPESLPGGGEGADRDDVLHSDAGEREGTGEGDSGTGGNRVEEQGEPIPDFLLRMHPDSAWLTKPSSLPTALKIAPVTYADTAAGNVPGTAPATVPVTLPEDPLEKLAAVATLPRGEAPKREPNWYVKQRKEKAYKRVNKMLAKKNSKSYEGVHLSGKAALKFIWGDK